MKNTEKKQMGELMNGLKILIFHTEIGSSQLAGILGVTRQAVGNWCKDISRIPPSRKTEIAMLIGIDEVWIRELSDKDLDVIADMNLYYSPSGRYDYLRFAPAYLDDEIIYTHKGVGLPSRDGLSRQAWKCINEKLNIIKECIESKIEKGGVHNEVTMFQCDMILTNFINELNSMSAEGLCRKLGLTYMVGEGVETINESIEEKSTEYKN